MKIKTGKNWPSGQWWAQVTVNGNLYNRFGPSRHSAVVNLLHFLAKEVLPATTPRDRYVRELVCG